MANNWLPANWPAPARVRAGTTTRIGGVSNAPYDSFNLALHVGDDLDKVRRNREQLVKLLDLPADPVWLKQQHGGNVINGDQQSGAGADACITGMANIVCAVITADCIPLLMCNRSGTQVAAIHAGWRGLCAGIIANSIAEFNESHERLLAWIGPHICARHYPVQAAMRNACLQSLSTASASAFSHAGNEQWFADLEKLARIELEQLGVTAIFTSGRCSYSEADTFYSYRRNNETGRMASLIWITSED